MLAVLRQSGTGDSMKDQVLVATAALQALRSGFPHVFPIVNTYAVHGTLVNGRMLFMRGVELESFSDEAVADALSRLMEAIRAVPSKERQFGRPAIPGGVLESILLSDAHYAVRVTTAKLISVDTSVSRIDVLVG